MAMNLDNFLNFIIPIILIILFVAFLWWKFKDPLISFFEWLKGLTSSSKDKAIGTIQTTKEIVYDI